MFNFFKRKNSNPVLREMDGREVKYVTRRTYKADGSPEENIIGKTGRIVLLDNEIRILCGEIDVFRGDKDCCEYFRLMSGNGITVDGFNKLLNAQDNITVYYKYHR